MCVLYVCIYIYIYIDIYIYPYTYEGVCVYIYVHTHTSSFVNIMFATFRFSCLGKGASEQALVALIPNRSRDGPHPDGLGGHRKELALQTNYRYRV